MRGVHAVGNVVSLPTLVWHASLLRERSADTWEVLRVLRGDHRDRRVIGEDGHDRRAELENTTIVNSLTAFGWLVGNRRVLYTPNSRVPSRGQIIFQGPSDAQRYILYCGQLILLKLRRESDVIGTALLQEHSEMFRLPSSRSLFDPRR